MTGSTGSNVNESFEHTYMLNICHSAKGPPAGHSKYILTKTLMEY